MGKEIERKFLVKSRSFMQQATGSISIKQAYLASKEEGFTVRLRVLPNEAILTIKGPSHNQGLERGEWEYPIDIKDAEEMLKQPLLGYIEKERFFVPYQNHIWEVDCFKGQNDGAMLAEVELKDANETVMLPQWVGQEVTGLSQYYNAVIAVEGFPEQS